MLHGQAQAESFKSDARAAPSLSQIVSATPEVIMTSATTSAPAIAAGAVSDRTQRRNDFERTNADLLQYLTYIRGADAANFGKAAEGPIRIGSAADEDRYKDYTNYFG